MKTPQNKSSTLHLVAWDDGTKQPIYLPTEKDRLWLLRAVEGEGPDQTQVAQVLTNRFLYLRARLPNAYATLADLVRAYSQPVNPRWMRGGDKWDAAWSRAKTEAKRTELLALDKRRRAHSARTTFAASTEAAVTRALTAGSLDIPPTAVHFAAPGQGRKSLPALTQPRNANWLHTEAPAATWQGYRATTELPINVASTKGVALIGVALVGMMLGKGRKA